MLDQDLRQAASGVEVVSVFGSPGAELVDVAAVSENLGKFVLGALVSCVGAGAELAELIAVGQAFS